MKLKFKQIIIKILVRYFKSIHNNTIKIKEFLIIQILLIQRIEAHMINEINKNAQFA